MKLAGNETVGTYDPDQLYAGEADVVTTQGVVASGQDLAEFTVVTQSGGQMFAWNKDGTARATITFSGVGTADDTVTINGDTITLKASATAGQPEVTIGGTATATAQALKTYINEHSDTLGVTATGAAAVITISANEPGTGGNGITLAKSSTAITVSSATLTGGGDDSVPYGVLPHAVNTSSTGLNADSDSPVIIGGVLNFDKLVADSATYDVLREAFARSNSNIVIQKLY